MRAFPRFLLVSVILMGATAGCDRRTPTPAPGPDVTAEVSDEPGPGGGGGKGLAAPEPTPGVRFRLSDADAADSSAGEAVPLASTEPLSPEDLAALLGRLPALPEAASEQVDFALRPGPKPPRVTGDAVMQPFPPDETAGSAPDVAPEPLTVTRHQPDGDVEMAPRLSLTFSKPMVPLTSHAALAAAEVPVTLAPQPPGEWRWAGSQTLVFQPEGGRFPMATDYTATVPAGLKSALGDTLAEAFTWSFRTPPPKVTDFDPESGDSTDVQPLIFIAFDQRVDAETLLPHVTATADGKSAALRLATAAEVEADEEVKRMAEAAEEGRWVALRPVEALPLAATVKVDVGPGLPSAEGPRTTEEAQSFEFEVHGPLEVKDLNCMDAGEAISWNDHKDRVTNCEPNMPWYIGFTNPLDQNRFDPASVTIEPELQGATVKGFEGAIEIQGASKGRTTYRVTLPAGLLDEFGQTLGEDVTVTFETGDMRSALYAPGDDMVVLDPAGEPNFEVFSINNDALNVQLYQVAPEDWPAYMDARWRQNEENPPGPPGEQVWSGTVKPAAKTDEIVPVAIDLAPALSDGLGQVLVVVEPAEWSWEDDNYNNKPQWRWVQATQLGLSAFTDSEGTLVWVNALADGKPIAGAAVTGPPGQAPTTDGDGLATLESVGDVEDNPTHSYIVAKKGADVALLPRGYTNWSFGKPGEQLSWSFFTDRGLYKPGEEVHFKGWVRRFDPGKGGDVAALSGGPTNIDYVLTASNGDEIGKGTLPVGAFGGFDGVVTLPADIELGYAQLQMTADDGEMPAGGREFGAAINVAEFRRPEFEVKVASEQPYYFIGDRGVVSAQASYYAGGPLPNAETNWNVTASPTTFTPPGRDDFYFGTSRPMWIYWDSGIDRRESSYEDHSGRTDATGTHRLAIDIDGVYPLSPASFRAEGTVMDVNRQAWTGTTTFLAHPARDYVGLRADRWFVEAGDPFAIEAIVADIDGKLVPGRPIKLVADKVDTTWRDGESTEDLTPAGGCDTISADDPVTCELSFETGGEYRVTATIADAEGRPNMTQLTLWVSGAPTVPQRGVEQQRVILVPDKDEYQPGDTAEILVQAPFAPAEGLLSIRRSGLVRTESFRMDEGSTTLKVPVDESLIPNFTVQVDLNGAAERAGADGKADPNLPERPAYASGSLDLKVPPLVRTLTVAATPREAAIVPGGSTTIDIVVEDADGKPLANSEVALVVVDEAVLALDGYAIPDPMDTFYPQRGADVGDIHQRAYLQLADPAAMASRAAQEVLDVAFSSGSAASMGSGDMKTMEGASVAEMGMPAPAADMAMRSADASALALAVVTAEPSAPRIGGADEPPPPVTERTDLNPLAAFVPSATTDASGKVALEITLPDNVTRYRITAVSTDGAKRFGKGESTLTARLPLVIRPSAPRFLNFGDAFELPVVVQNQTEADLPVDVVIRAANMKLTDGLADEASQTVSAGQRVTVPAGDRVELRFPAGADMPGTAAFQAGAFAVDVPEAADAQRVTLPVWTPATTEAFATYGTIDEGAIAQPVQRPPDVVEQFGGLELTTSSTAVSELTDAFLYLESYPFEGSEQIASRLIATLALKDVLASFGAEGLPSPAEVDAAIRRDIFRLVSMQNSDGGWDWWRAEGQSSPFATIHVAHALARARAKNYVLGQDTLSSEHTLDRAKDYLVHIDDHLREISFCECPEAFRAIRAYALYTRMLLDDRDTATARAIFAEIEDSSDRTEIETLGWLLSVMSGDAASEAEVAEIRRRIANAASEEAGTAQFSTDYSETEGAVLLGSDRRADAIVLDALMTDQPDSDLIPKVVRGLLDHRTNGRWGSTQENGWVLLALERYFQTYEKATPDFLARAWLGDGFIGEQAYRGRTTERGETKVPLTELPAEGTTDVTLEKDGAGRLYYRLGLRYAPEDLTLEPLERGFSVERSYEAVDDPADVRRTADGTWEIRAGSRVRVKLTLVAPARRYHVALVDPLPAGLEAVNPDLAVSGTAPPNPDDPAQPADIWPWWRWWRWYDHEAFRDERVEVFSNLLWDGVYTYDYIARATTPGDFVVPPTKAEELYHAETFGRGGTDRVKVVVR